MRIVADFTNRQKVISRITFTTTYCHFKISEQLTLLWRDIFFNVCPNAPENNLKELKYSIFSHLSGKTFRSREVTYILCKHICAAQFFEFRSLVRKISDFKCLYFYSFKTASLCYMVVKHGLLH